MKNAIIRTLPEAPQDSKLYGRNNAQWVEIDLSGIGTGDMNKAIYDPNLIEADVYDRSNHTGTQLSSTISDFATTVTTTNAVVLNTAKVSFPEAPNNGTAYARQNETWVATESFVDAPSDGQYYSRRNNSWAVSSGLADAPSDDYRYVRRQGNWERLNTSDGIDYGTGNQYACGASTTLESFSNTLQSLFPDGTDLQGKQIILIIDSSRSSQTLTIPRVSNGRIYISASPSSSTFTNCTFNLDCSNCHIRLVQSNFSTNSSPTIISDGFNNTVTLTGLGIDLKSNPNGLIEPTGFSQILFTGCSFSGDSFPRLIKRSGTGSYDPVTVTFHNCTGDISGIVVDGVGILAVRDPNSSFTFASGANGGAMFIQA